MENDRRKSERIEYGVNVEYLLADGSKVQFGKIFNSSIGGCSMRTTKEISPDTNIKFKIEEQETFIPAKVIWCQKTPVQIGEDNSFDVGLEYEEAIKGYVNQILKKIDDTSTNLGINS